MKIPNSYIKKIHLSYFIDFNINYYINIIVYTFIESYVVKESYHNILNYIFRYNLTPKQ